MAANVLGRIAVTLGLDSAAFEQGLSKAAKQANANAKEIEKGFKGLGGTFDSLLGPLAQLGGAFGSTLAQMGSQIGAVVRQLGPLGASFGGVGLAAAGVGGALVAAGAAAVGLAISGASVVEEIEHLSEKTGISRDDLVAWKAVAKASGSSLESFETSMRKFEKSLGGTNAAAKETQAVLKSIGVSTKDPQEALLQVADAFEKMPDGAQKAAIAIALFGRAGTEMIPTLDRGRDAVLKWRQIAKELGPDISEGAVKAAQDWKDATEKMSLSWDKLKVSMVPVLTTLAGALSILQQMTIYDVSHVLDFGYKGPAAAKPDLNKVFAGAEAIAQQQILDDAQKQYDLVKARGPLELKLLETQKEISEALKTDTTESIKRATTLQSEIPALQKAADLERQRTAEMERRAEIFKRGMADLEATHGAVRPGAAKSTIKPGDTSGLFGPQPSSWDVLAGEAPSLGGQSGAGALEPSIDNLSLLANLTAQYRTYMGQTTEEINAYWDSQIKAMNALLAASHASQEVIDEMNKEANALRSNALAGADAEAMKAAKNAVRDGTASFQQAWEVAFDNVKKGGANLAQTLGAAMGTMVQDINHGLAELIVTGKGLNFKEIAQKFAVTMVQSVLQKGESSLLGALGFGGLGKPDGSSSKPFYVTPVGPGGMVGSLAGGDGGSIFSGGIGAIMHLFGLPFLAGGGDVTPGQSFIVGESGPELFTPASAGTVSPNSSLRTSGSSAQVVYNIDARGADAGVEQRLRVAMRDTENRAVVRSVATMNDLQKRR